MAEDFRQESTKFIVDLGPLKLPSSLEKELESEMQRLALSVIAKVDYRGDLRVGRIPPGYFGFIFGEWPPWFPRGTFDEDEHPQGGDPKIVTRLGVEDHTLLMQLVMDRPLQVVRHLDQARREKRKPTPLEAVQAAAKLTNLSSHAANALDAVQTELVKLSRAKLSRPAVAAMSELNARIDAANGIDDLIATLRAAERSGEFSKVDGANVGLNAAARILEYGRTTIYSDTNPFYQDAGRTAAKSGVLTEDAKGAISGALGGAAAGATAGPGGILAGACAGAVAGAAGGSIAQAVTEILGWLFD